MGLPTSVGIGPNEIAINSAGTRLYVNCVNSGGVYEFNIDPTSGALTAISGSPVAIPGAGQTGITLNPAGTFAFVTNGDNFLSSISVYSVSQVTGQLTFVGTFAVGTAPPDWPITDASGTYLYVPTSTGQLIYQYDIANDGTLSAISGSPIAGVNSPTVPALSPNGKFLYVPSFSRLSGGATSTIGVYAIDPVSGALTPASGSPFTATVNLASIAIDPSGTFAYVPSETGADVIGYSLNSTTGALTALPSTYPAGSTASIITLVTTNP